MSEPFPRRYESLIVVHSFVNPLLYSGSTRWSSAISLIEGFSRYRTCCRMLRWRMASRSGNSSSLDEERSFLRSISHYFGRASSFPFRVAKSDLPIDVAIINSARRCPLGAVTVWICGLVVAGCCKGQPSPGGRCGTSPYLPTGGWTYLGSLPRYLRFPPLLVLVGASGPIHTDLSGRKYINRDLPR